MSKYKKLYVFMLSVIFNMFYGLGCNSYPNKGIVGALVDYQLYDFGVPSLSLVINIPLALGYSLSECGLFG